MFVVANIRCFGVWCWFPFMASLTLTHGVRVINRHLKERLFPDAHTCLLCEYLPKRFPLAQKGVFSLPRLPVHVTVRLCLRTAYVSELQKTHVILEITRQQSTGFLSCSFQRPGKSCVCVMLHGKGVMVNLGRSQSSRTETVGLSG